MISLFKGDTKSRQAKLPSSQLCTSWANLVGKHLEGVSTFSLDAVIGMQVMKWPGMTELQCGGSIGVCEEDSMHMVILALWVHLASRLGQPPTLVS